MARRVFFPPIIFMPLLSPKLPKHRERARERARQRFPICIFFCCGRSQLCGASSSGRKILFMEQLLLIYELRSDHAEEGSLARYRRHHRTNQRTNATPLSPLAYPVAPLASERGDVEMHYGFLKVSDSVEVLALRADISHHNMELIENPKY